MDKCFVPLKISINPLRYDLIEYLKDWPNSTQNKILDNAYLNPELINFFKSLDISLRENFIFWFWNTQQNRYPHTDGDWNSDDHIIKKRQCGINWNFTRNSWVEFYEFPERGHEIKYFNDWDFSTVWKEADKIIAVWQDESPVIFNPQIPHMVKSHSLIKKRASITLRFYEDYDSLIYKLKNYIK